MAAPDSDWPSLAIVVPVFNEASTIEDACREIVDVAESYSGRALLIAVDDGSSDGSTSILARLADQIDVLQLERHGVNAGYGAALRTGAERAQALGFDYVAFIDSDLTNPPRDLLKIGELARAGHVYIKASRFVRGGSMASVRLSRRVVSKAGNLVARMLFWTNVRDVTNGFRAVRTDLFNAWPLQEHGFPAIVEEFDWALRSGIEPAEFPTVLSARGEEQRRSAFSYSPSLVMSYSRYPVRAFFRRLRDVSGRIGRG